MRQVPPARTSGAWGTDALRGHSIHWMLRWCIRHVRTCSDEQQYDPALNRVAFALRTRCDWCDRAVVVPGRTSAATAAESCHSLVRGRLLDHVVVRLLVSRHPLVCNRSTCAAICHSRLRSLRIHTHRTLRSDVAALAGVRYPHNGAVGGGGLLLILSNHTPHLKYFDASKYFV